MLLAEITTPNQSVQNLTRRIRFIINPDESKVLNQKLERLGITPSINNVKSYLIRWLTVPLDQVPFPEQSIIIRSGRAERI